MVAGVVLLDRLKIDDPVGAVPVHGFNGLWGTIAVGMLESKPGSTPTELEAALNSLFIGMLGVADRVRVTNSENQIKVEIYNPRMENKATWGQQCLGSPLPSMVASVAAEAWNKPVIIKQEERHKDKYSIELEVMGEDI